MSTLVMKFGGASVASLKSFDRVSDIILRRREEFQNIVVVVSAMGNETDRLIALAKKVHSDPPKRELDMLVSVGERVSMSLLAMALNMKGASSISFTGSQSGIITSNEHSDARIVDVRPKRIIAELAANRIVVVAGFQGVSREGEITTLGRGGSDTTAVALAIALNANRVEFYKDVNGIYSSDPKMDAEAKFHTLLSYEEAISIVERGGVLHPRCVKLAALNSMPLHIRSYKKLSGNGTVIKKDAFKKDQKGVYENI